MDGAHMDRLLVTGVPLAGSSPIAAHLQAVVDRPPADAIARLSRLDGVYAALYADWAAGTKSV